MPPSQRQGSLRARGASASIADEQQIDVLQQLPGDVAVAPHEGPEVGQRHDEAADLGCRGHGRGTRTVADERDVPEIATRAAPAGGPVVGRLRRAAALAVQ